MGNSEEMKEKYLKLKQEFETYQNFAENTIQMMNEKNTKLEKKLDALTNIVEVSKYINSNVSDDNLIPMINDMIIGILGVTYSSIYLSEDNNLIIKATNVPNQAYNFTKYSYFKELNNGKAFVVNCKDSIFPKEACKVNIHSIIGVPIYLGERFQGYIVVEHTLCNFFGHDHINFISAIANQIGIALENNFLYNKVRESSITDPLLPIYNRKYFFDITEEKLLKNPEHNFAIVMIDIDNFKKFNDGYGHQFGDQVLIQTASVIKNNIDKDDIVARYGGEEIVIYIKNVDNYDDVFQKVDEIRINIENNLVKHGETEKSVTASFGISFYSRNGNTIQKVLSVADNMLYEAKRTGKNKVVSSHKFL